jgi:hypothetical protein
VKFTTSLAAELAALDAALDEPGSAIGQGLHRLAAAAAAAVPSYLGLSVVVTRHDPVFTLTLLDHVGAAGDIGTSILLTLPNPADSHAVAAVAFILYARSPGAFVDLAADASWLTGGPPTDFVLDAHLGVPAEPDSATPIAVASVINQAIGALIGRGYTALHAHRELDAQAAQSGTERVAAAQLVLARLTTGDHQFDVPQMLTFTVPSEGQPAATRCNVDDVETVNQSGMSTAVRRCPR